MICSYNQKETRGLSRVLDCEDLFLRVKALKQAFCCAARAVDNRDRLRGATTTYHPALQRPPRSRGPELPRRNCEKPGRRCPGELAIGRERRCPAKGPRSRGAALPRRNCRSDEAALPRQNDKAAPEGRLVGA